VHRRHTSIRVVPPFCCQSTLVRTSGGEAEPAPLALEPLPAVLPGEVERLIPVLAGRLGQRPLGGRAPVPAPRSAVLDRLTGWLQSRA
jgi:hypothetical protein